MKILLITLIFVFLSCFGPTEPINKSIHIYGTVFDESLDKPLNNILIHLNRYNEQNISAIIDSERTDYNGRFHFEYDSLDESRFTLELLINFFLRNHKFSSKREKISVNSFIDIKLFLYEYTQLEVVLTTNSPLTHDDRFQIDLPGISTGGLGPIQDSIFNTPLAKGNFYNQIKFTYDRNGINHVLVDSVYCPINTKTNLIVNY